MSRGTPGRYVRSCRAGSGLGLGIVLMLLGVLVLDSTAPLGLRAIIGLLLLLGATIFIAALVCLLSPSTYDTEVLVTDHEIIVQRPFRLCIPLHPIRRSGRIRSLVPEDPIRDRSGATSGMMIRLRVWDLAGA